VPRSWWMKVSSVFIFVLLCILYLTPSWMNVETLPAWMQYVVPKQALKLGLDLQGGLHIVMGIEPEKVLQENLDVILEDLKEDLKKIGPSITFTRSKEEESIRVKFENREQAKEITKQVKNRYPVFDIHSEDAHELTLSFSTQERKFRIQRAVEQSIEAIRNRIDEFGVSEPSIIAEGRDRIIVQLPGVQDPERAKELIGRTAKLEFKLVDETMPQGQIAELVQKAEKEKGISYQAGSGQKFSDYLNRIREAVAKETPKDAELAFEKQVNDQTGVITWLPYFLQKKAAVTGDHVRDARVFPDPQTNEYKVLLKFNAQGTKPFAKVTKENVGRRLAIVLDHLVHSAPVIQSEIPSGEATITLGAYDNPQALFKEAQDTALVLRAGALPTTIELLEERTVGPSLGADSIRHGKKALLIGLAFVVVFMMVYYKGSGVIANLALVLNLIFILALLAMLGATLTLPGIAGIVLTMGMAVDANVLIFERIREEIRAGKSAKAAIQSGFEKAWSTIFDANTTTIIAALALLAEGTGPIKGFAVTLAIGIVSSVFTAVYVSRLCYDFILTKFEITKVSI